MERRNKKNLILVLLFLLIFGIAIWQLLKWENTPEENPDESQSSIGTVEYEGKTYKYNTNITNILFLGIDNNSEMTESTSPGNAGQSDCIMLLSLNKETKEATILQIPRDTMTDVDIYDMNGNYYATVYEQVATQFAYSIGGESSGWATKKTVSELLFDLPIDGYLAIDMASIPIINDALGGVTVTFEEDYTEINPEFVEGTTLTLNGEQADDFIHYRDTTQSFSNYGRMQRQLQYVPALIDAIKNKVGEGGDYYETFYPLVEKYMVTDLSISQINELADYNLVTSEVQVLPGEGKKGEKYEEFYVDEKILEKNMIEMFYILKD